MLTRITLLTSCNWGVDAAEDSVVTGCVCSTGAADCSCVASCIHALMVILTSYAPHAPR